MTPIHFVRPVRLPGPRCVLREWADDDVPALHALLTEPRVFDRVLDDRPPTRDEVRAALSGWREEAAGEPRPAYRLAAVGGAGDDSASARPTPRVGLASPLLGLGTLTVESVPHRRGEIGYVVHPDHWGRGLGTEIARLLLSLAFDQVGLHRVEATTRPDHVASRRVLEKAGMRPEGVSRDHLLVRGSWWDSVRYAILATDR
ncbi:GNAT family protein [Micromonospora sp. NPDC023966]|uniref:GNAT family N-acetyltransferase n=1 Tax=Micromonospora sp. NPDC023966 TaxID=3154699 RepID=UPI0033C4C4E9